MRKVSHKLKQAHEETVDLCAGLEFQCEMQLEALKAAAHRASHEGASLSDIAAAWSGVHPQLAKVAAQELRTTIPWGTKVAARSIHPEHAVMRKFAAFTQSALRLNEALVARQSIEAELAKVGACLEETAS